MYLPLYFTTTYLPLLSVPMNHSVVLFCFFLLRSLIYQSKNKYTGNRSSHEVSRFDKENTFLVYSCKSQLLLFFYLDCSCHYPSKSETIVLHFPFFFLVWTPLCRKSHVPFRSYNIQFLSNSCSYTFSSCFLSNVC